jgi:outer membrane immunogenic protein
MLPKVALGARQMNQLLLASGFVLAMAGGALAADAVIYDPAPGVPIVSGYNWSGFYVGAHAGYGWAKSETDDIFAYDLEPEGWLGGLQAGYNHQFENNVVIGLEADVSFGDLNDESLVLAPIGDPPIFFIPNTASAEIKAMGTIRGRIGYAFDRILPYVTGGIGWAHQEVAYAQDLGFGFFTNIDEAETHIGWTLGAGLEAALSDRWTTKVEYLYSDFGSKNYVGTSSFGPFPASIDLQAQTVKIGLNYKFN